MKLDLTEIARTIGMHSIQEVEEPCPEDLGLDCLSPIKGRLEIRNTGSLLLVSGSMETEVRLECGRCLLDYTLLVKTPLEEEFRLEKTGEAVRVLPMDEEDTSTRLVVNNILDVQELARQNLLLNLPIQPLCRPDCKGLCPACGENLNMGKCMCPPAEPESPFHVLAELLTEENENA